MSFVTQVPGPSRWMLSTWELPEDDPSLCMHFDQIHQQTASADACCYELGGKTVEVLGLPPFSCPL